MTEKEAGKIAALMMQRSLRQILLKQNFKKSISGKNSIYRSKGLARMHKYNKEELRGIAIKMPKHGFILQSGVSGERRGGIVERKKPRTTFYQRKSHPFYIQSYDFIDDAVQRSGAVEYLSQTIGVIKTDQVIEIIKFGMKDGKQ